MTGVKSRALRHPAALAAGGAAIAALLGLNVAAFVGGLSAPWLLGGVIIADIVVIGVGVLVAAREVLTAEEGTAAARAALEAAETRLGAIVDSAMDAVITTDEAQNVVLFNRAAEQVFGVRREQAIGAPLDRFIPQRFRGEHRRHVEQFARTGVTSRRMGDVTTLWALRADGTEFPIEASISQAVEAGRRYFTVILRDITMRKRNEDELRRQQQELRELSAQVLEAREEEKTRIARELHDELGQLLTALKMDVATLSQLLAGTEHARRTEDMAALLDKTVTATRRISADLRPLMLDDLGLADAAAWLVDDFSKRSSIAARIDVGDGEALDALPAAVSTALYRAVQESLTNVARHAQARNAWVVFRATGSEIQVEIEDDGRGIGPADLAKARSLGLKGMRERIAYIGGTLDVGAAPRGGTRVSLRVPRRDSRAEAPA